MGRSHESTGMLAYVGAVALGLGHPTLPQLAAGAVIASGASLLPDLDHPDAAPAHALGFVTEGIARVVNRVARLLPHDGGAQLPGHREVTHWPPVVAAVGVGVWAAQRAADRWWMVGILFSLTLFAARVLGPRVTRRSVLAACAAAGLVTWATWRWVPPGGWEWQAVVVGYAAHLAGDSLSARGIPIWPFGRLSFTFPLPWRRKRFSLCPVGSVREHVLASCALLAVAYLGWGFVVAPR